MNKIYWATEIYTTATTVTDPTWGVNGGVFRWVTGRPQYNGTVTPTWAPAGVTEIDVNGNVITPGSNNIKAYYEDILLEDFDVGNPQRQNDFSVAMNYDMGATFSFKIRGDNQPGSYFWQFCQTNSITLSNAIVRLYVVLNDVFYSQWRGIVSTTSYTETDYTINCIDEGTILHKIIPPDQINIVTTTTTAITTVSNNVSNANTNVVNDIVPAPNQQVTQETIPVVFGNVPFSPIVKFSDQNTYALFVSDTSGVDFDDNIMNFPDTYETAASKYYYTAGSVQAGWDTSTHLCALDLVHLIPENYFAVTNFNYNVVQYGNDDTRLTGSFLNVISGTDADTEQCYKITSNNTTYKATYTDGFGDSTSFYVTPIFFEDALITGSKTLVQTADFNGSSPNNSSNYSYNIVPATGYPMGANANTWWFKVSSFDVPTVISTVNYDGGPLNMAEQYNAQALPAVDAMGNDSSGVISAYEYDKDLNTYIDVSDVLSISSEANDVRITSDTASPDGKFLHTENIGYTVDVYGIRYLTSGSGLGSPLTPSHSNQAPYYTGSFANAPLGGEYYYYITPGRSNEEIPINRCENPPSTSSVVFDLSYLDGINSYYYLTVRYKVQPLAVQYDNIYFLSDFRLQLKPGSGQTNYFSILPLQYSLFDNNGRIIRNGPNWQNTVMSVNSALPNSSSSYFTLVDGSPADFHLIPSDYYNTLSPGYTSKYKLWPSSTVYNYRDDLFLSPTPYDTQGTYPWQNWFNLNSQAPNAGTSVINSITQSHVGYVEFYIPLVCTGSKWGKLQLLLSQFALIGTRMVDTIKGDLYVRTQGEATDAYNTFSPGSNPTTFNSYGQLMTNSVASTYMHILEDYDTIPHAMIDYDLSNLSNYGLFSQRGQAGSSGGQGYGPWMVGRTITDQKSSSDYLNELCAQGFTGMFTNRLGQRALRGFEPLIQSETVAVGKTPAHDDTIIIAESISSFEKTDWSQLYNSFNVRYNWDPGLKDFTKFYSITHVDDVRGFPAMTQAGDAYNRDWTTYVSGAGIGYTTASNLWAVCHNQWLLNKVVKLCSSDIGDCYWFIDSCSFNPTDGSSSGISSSAYKLLEHLVGQGGEQTVPGWSTTQKDIVTYSIPITANTCCTEIFDCITFTDAVWTNGVSRTGWISSIEVDIANSQYIIKAILLPVGQ